MKSVRLALAVACIVAWQQPAYSQDAATSALTEFTPTSNPQLILGTAFRGKSSALGWRLAGMFVSGVEQARADANYTLDFLDAELPLQQAAVRTGFDLDSARQRTLVGPFQRARSEAWRLSLQATGIAQMAFSLRENGQSIPQFTLALDPGINAAALADYLCRESQTRRWSLVIPQNPTGERFARSFALAAAQCPDSVLDAVTWYREDLEDLTVRAREHYGIDRVPFEALERQQRGIDTVEGLLLSDVTVVIATPDNLQRLLNELIYQGSSFQVFVGDFNFGHGRVLTEVKWSVPPVFLDHYPRTDAITQSASFQHFIRSAQKFVRGQPTTADLLLYEAGQLASQQALSKPSDKTYETAGGHVRATLDGTFVLPLYPLTVSDGTVVPASTGLIDGLVARQKEQHQKFIQAREAARAAKGKKDAITPP